MMGIAKLPRTAAEAGLVSKAIDVLEHNQFEAEANTKNNEPMQEHKAPGSSDAVPAYGRNITVYPY